MQRLMRFAHGHPVLVALVLAVVTAACLWVARDIRVDASVGGMMTDDPQARQIYGETIDTFGTDQVTIVFLRHPDLFDPRRLAVVEELAYQLEGLPGVVRVESLFSASDFRSDGVMLYAGPLMRLPPETREEAAEVRRKALENPLIAKNLLSEDGTATSVNVFVEPAANDPDYYTHLASAIEELMVPARASFEDVFQLGAPYLRTAISDAMLHDQFRLVPLSVGVLVLTLLLMTRSLAGALLPLLTAGMSVAWTAAFMVLAGIPLNILTIIVPSLIIVIGSTEDVHLLSEYMEGLRRRGTGEAAFRFMVSKMGVVIMITSLTTFLGFASITVNKIEILHQFGMAAAFGLLVNPIITVLFVPVYLRFFGPFKVRAPATPQGPDGENVPAGEPQRGLSFFDMLGRAATAAVNRHNRKMVALLLLVAVFIGVFAVDVRLNNDLMGIFKESSPLRQRAKAMSQWLPGAQTFLIRITGGHEGAFRRPEALRAVADLQDFIARSPDFDASHSLVDTLRYINRQMHDGQAEEYRVPDTEALVAQNLLFVRDADLQRTVSADFSRCNILVRHSLQSSHELKQALASLEAHIQAGPGRFYRHDFTGESMLILAGADSIAKGQVWSVGLLLAIIFIIMSVLFVNVKAGLLSLAPNVFPVLVMFGAMGLLKIPLNIGTAMVSAIAIGIAVDDTIHFMTRYNKEMLRLKDQHRAMEECIHAEIRPVVSTSLALALGFGVLAFSQFVTIIQFGVLSALVMVVALVGDLFITGPLLSNTKLLTIWDMLSLHVDPKIIETSEFFRDLRLGQIKKIILMGRIQERPASEVIFSEWDDGDSMYLILKGEVRAYSEDEDTGKEVPYALFGVGDVFGQTAMLDPGSRSYSARAEADLHLAEISHDDFRRLQRVYPRIAGRAYCNLARILGHRLAISNFMYRQKAGQGWQAVEKSREQGPQDQ